MSRNSIRAASWDETAVKRDTDSGEEGQFDYKDAAAKSISQKQKSENERKKGELFLQWLAQQDEETKKFFVWARDEATDAERKALRQIAESKSEQLRKQLQHALRNSPAMVFEIAESLNWPRERRDDGAWAVVTPWGEMLRDPAARARESGREMKRPKTSDTDRVDVPKDWDYRGGKWHDGKGNVIGYAKEEDSRIRWADGFDPRPFLKPQAPRKTSSKDRTQRFSSPSSSSSGANNRPRRRRQSKLPPAYNLHADKEDGSAAASPQDVAGETFLRWLAKQPQGDKDFYAWINGTATSQDKKNMAAIAKSNAASARKKFASQISNNPTKALEIAAAENWPRAENADGSTTVVTPWGALIHVPRKKKGVRASLDAIDMEKLMRPRRNPRFELQALVAASRRWNPDLHPRGRDGRFIEVLGWVKAFVDMFDGPDGKSGNMKRKQVVGQVQDIVPNPDKPGHPTIRVKVGRGDNARMFDLDASRIEQSAAQKARLDELISASRNIDLDPDADVDFNNLPDAPDDFDPDMPMVDIPEADINPNVTKNDVQIALAERINELDASGYSAAMDHVESGEYGNPDIMSDGKYARSTVRAYEKEHPEAVKTLGQRIEAELGAPDDVLEYSPKSVTDSADAISNDDSMTTGALLDRIYAEDPDGFSRAQDLVDEGKYGKTKSMSEADYDDATLRAYEAEIDGERVAALRSGTTDVDSADMPDENAALLQSHIDSIKQSKADALLNAKYADSSTQERQETATANELYDSRIAEAQSKLDAYLAGEEVDLSGAQANADKNASAKNAHSAFLETLDKYKRGEFNVDDLSDEEFKALDNNLLYQYSDWDSGVVARKLGNPAPDLDAKNRLRSDILARRTRMVDEARQATQNAKSEKALASEPIDVDSIDFDEIDRLASENDVFSDADWDLSDYVRDAVNAANADGRAVELSDLENAFSSGDNPLDTYMDQFVLYDGEGGYDGYLPGTFEMDAPAVSAFLTDVLDKVNAQGNAPGNRNSDVDADSNALDIPESPDVDSVPTGIDVDSDEDEIDNLFSTAMDNLRDNDYIQDRAIEYLDERGADLEAVDFANPDTDVQDAVEDALIDGINSGAITREDVLNAIGTDLDDSQRAELEEMFGIDLSGPGEIDEDAALAEHEQLLAETKENSDRLGRIGDAAAELSTNESYVSELSDEELESLLDDLNNVTDSRVSAKPSTVEDLDDAVRDEIALRERGTAVPTVDAPDNSTDTDVQDAEAQDRARETISLWLGERREQDTFGDGFSLSDYDDADVAELRQALLDIDEEWFKTFDQTDRDNYYRLVAETTDLGKVLTPSGDATSSGVDVPDTPNTDTPWTGSEEDYDDLVGRIEHYIDSNYTNTWGAAITDNERHDDALSQFALENPEWWEEAVNSALDERGVPANQRPDEDSYSDYAWAGGRKHLQETLSNATKSATPNLASELDVSPDDVDVVDVDLNKPNVPDAPDTLPENVLGRSLDGTDVEVGTKLTSVKDGISGTVTGVPKNGKYPGYVYIKPDNGGKIKLRSLKQLKAPGSTAEGSTGPSKKSVAQAATDLAPDVDASDADLDKPKVAKTITASDNVFGTALDGSEVKIGSNLVSVKDGFSGTVVGWPSDQEKYKGYVYVQDADGVKKLRSINKLKTPGETAAGKPEPGVNEKVPASPDALNAPSASPGGAQSTTASLDWFKSLTPQQQSFRQTQANDSINMALADSGNGNYRADNPTIREELRDTLDNDFPGWRYNPIDRSEIVTIKPPSGYEVAVTVGEAIDLIGPSVF